MSTGFGKTCMCYKDVPPVEGWGLCCSAPPLEHHVLGERRSPPCRRWWLPGEGRIPSSVSEAFRYQPQWTWHSSPSTCPGPFRRQIPSCPTGWWVSRVSQTYIRWFVLLVNDVWSIPLHEEQLYLFGKVQFNVSVLHEYHDPCGICPAFVLTEELNVPGIPESK